MLIGPHKAQPQTHSLYRVIALRGVQAGSKKLIVFASSRRSAFAWSLGMLVLIMAFASGVYAAGKRHAGAVYFEQGVRRAQGDAGNLEKALPALISGFNLYYSCLFHHSVNPS